jgi:hypothetical protein
VRQHGEVTPVRPFRCGAEGVAAAEEEQRSGGGLDVL